MSDARATADQGDPDRGPGVRRTARAGSLWTHESRRRGTIRQPGDLLAQQSARRRSAVVRHAEPAASDRALAVRGSARAEADDLRRIHRVAEPRRRWRSSCWRCGARDIGRSKRWLAITIGFALLALGPFIYVAGFNTHVPGPWALMRYVPVVGLARMPTRFAIVASIGVAVLMAGALASLGARWPERRRLIGAVGGHAAGVRTVAGAAHVVLGGDLADLRSHRRGSAAGPRPRVAVRRARRHVGDRQLPSAHALQPDAPRQGAHRRLPVAGLAAARPADAPGLPDARCLDHVEREARRSVPRSRRVSTSAAIASSRRATSATW